MPWSFSWKNWVKIKNSWFWFIFCIKFHLFFFFNYPTLHECVMVIFLQKMSQKQEFFLWPNFFRKMAKIHFKVGNLVSFDIGFRRNFLFVKIWQIEKFSFQDIMQANYSDFPSFISASALVCPTSSFFTAQFSNSVIDTHTKVEALIN